MRCDFYLCVDSEQAGWSDRLTQMTPLYAPAAPGHAARDGPIAPASQNGGLLKAFFPLRKK